MKILFKEVQKFNQWWLWLLLLGVGLIPAYAIYYQLILGEKVGTKPASDLEIALIGIFCLALIFFFLWIRLKTEINEVGIYIKYIPFLKRQVKWTQVKTAEVIDYGFVGGWGIRLWTKYGTVYNTRGKIGLAIELKNGKKFLIGTQKGAALKKILEKVDLNT